MANLDGNLWEWNLARIVVVDVTDDYRLMLGPMPSEFYPVLRELWVPRHQLSNALQSDDLVNGYLYDWHETPLDVAPRPPRHFDATAHDDFVFEFQIVTLENGREPFEQLGRRNDLRFDERRAGTVADARATARTSAQERESIDDDRLSSARFTGQDVEPRAELERSGLDDGEIGDGEMREHDPVEHALFRRRRCDRQCPLGSILSAQARAHCSIVALFLLLGFRVRHGANQLVEGRELLAIAFFHRTRNEWQ